MQATSLRVRLAPTFEWVVAAAFLVATVLVGLLLVREFRSTPAEAPAPLNTILMSCIRLPTKASGETYRWDMYSAL